MSAVGASIGIDLGTTYSCVGVWQNGRVEIIANDNGSRTTPSCVAFNGTERLIGDAAKNQVAMNASNTVFDAKRLIGRRFNDSVVQADMKHWPFKVVEGPDGKPLIQVTFKGETKRIKSEMVTATIIQYLLSNASAFLQGLKVKRAVITVPSCFNSLQRQHIMASGKLAGVSEVVIVNESTAAAVIVCVDKSTRCNERDDTIVVYHFGGGSCAVSVVSFAGNNIEVKATAGDAHLGGEDVDNRLVEHFVQEFKQKFNKDMSENQTALYRLRAACERAKITLSSASQAHLEIDSLHDGIDFNSIITRARFEELNMDYFRKCMEPVEKVLKDAKLSKSQVHGIVLVGGSTRIPKVQELLSEFFNCQLRQIDTLRPHAVCEGASILAAKLAGDASVPALSVQEVSPWTVVLSHGENKNKWVRAIPRNVALPFAVDLPKDIRGQINFFEGDGDEYQFCWSEQVDEDRINIDVVVGMEENGILLIRTFPATATTTAATTATADLTSGAAATIGKSEDVVDDAKTTAVSASASCTTAVDSSAAGAATAAGTDDVVMNKENLQQQQQLVETLTVEKESQHLPSGSVTQGNSGAVSGLVQQQQQQQQQSGGDSSQALVAQLVQTVSALNCRVDNQNRLIQDLQTENALRKVNYDKLMEAWHELRNDMDILKQKVCL